MDSKIESIPEEEDLTLEPLSRLPSGPSIEPIPICKCLTTAESSLGEVIPERKKIVFSTVTRTENYLRERRIPELMRFILTKILARNIKNNVTEFTAKLLDECMIFRAGHGVAPVLFEERHLEAVVKSFDPGHRGWLSAGQVRRAFTTLSLTPPINIEERTSTDVVLNNLRATQEQELFDLLSAGVPGFTGEESIQDNQTLLDDD
ncbi:hypothetical protein PYW08_006998 [Mythimna loreyi]|uniref:Uncharacterized protein n=1 Tax=Mythimna loreyi TaxID=667449 RepID=A0ACC2R925_9NEOP|nr:hypothetical protein PYW08_006998 [Mythimna loreyi]